MKDRRATQGLVAIALIAAGFLPATGWSQTEYLISADQTDQEIDEWLQPHVIEIDRTVQPHDLLVVHFPGSFDVPANSKLILQHAARRGYPAIGLRYPNSWTVNSLCSSSTDPDCFEKVRMEILDGIDRSDSLSVTEANSITNRLEKLLDYLDGEFPEDDWGRFLNGDGSVAWSKIVVAGHSQGAGHAAMVAHVHRVARVAMFAGVADYSAYFGEPSDWLTDAGATPIADYYGFGHTGDTLVPMDRLIDIWTALGLAEMGQPVNVDGTSPPFGGSHMLFTSAQPAVSGGYPEHNSVVVDQYTPKLEDDSPLFAEVWDFMLFPDDSSSGPGVRVRRPGRRVRPQ
jgi:hypothetical protein